MVFVSHAQNYEDVTLLRALGNIERGFYIDIGAFHDDKYSVTKAFYKIGWSGINVEPIPRLHRSLAEARPRDTNVCVAISDVPGTIELTIFEEAEFSTTLPETVDLHATTHRVSEVLEVPAVTLESLWEEYVLDGTDVHFLKLDVEGGEGAVIRSFDWARYRPWVVVVEATKPGTDEDTSSEWEQALLDANYELAYNDRLNRFYLATEHNSLSSKLGLPPSVHDGFIMAEEDSLRRQLVASREDHASQLRDLTQLNEQLVVNHQHEVREYARKLAAAEQAVFEGEARFNAVTASYSWRLTHPLRWLAGLVHRLFRGASPSSKL